jgi:DNA-binding MarR family transcriptional regulator
VYLKLTGEGEKLHRTTCDQVDARYDVIESVLSKDKLKQLQSLLGELSAIGQHID